MRFIPDNLYHLYNQGNNRQTIFHNHHDYNIFLQETIRCLLPHSEVIAYCFMPNHFHFLIYADDRCNTVVKQGGLYLDPVTNGIRKLLSSYARISNHKYNQSGSVFRQKTKSKCLSDSSILTNKAWGQQDYYFNCFHYIHQNPLRAKLVQRLEDWEYSSFNDYTGLKNTLPINKQLAMRFCSYNPDNFIKTSYQVIPEHLSKHL